MRIVHLSAYGGPYPGSFIPMLRAVNDAATKRGWSFEAVFTPEAALHPWYAGLIGDGVATRIAPDGPRRVLAAWVKSLATEQRQDTVLHSHFTKFDLPVVAAALRRKNMLAMWHMHTRLGPGHVELTRNVLKLAIVGHFVDRILCVSQDLADGLQKRCAPSRRLLVFPNAIDRRLFSPATREERKEAKAKLGVPATRPLLVHFGWGWDIKGGDLFLESVAALSHRGIDVTAMCVGGGEPARAASVRLGIEDRVLVAPARDDVRTLYAAADVFVSSSPAEGAMPLATLESLSVGTPVVGSRIPNHVLLAEQADGCVLAERDPQSFATALSFVLCARAETSSRVGLAGLADSLDLQSWAQRLIDLYIARFQSISG